jgi:MFS family permease
VEAIPVRERLARAGAALASNARNPGLRRAQLSFLAAWTAEWAFTVGLGIVAYRDGGAATVGLVGLLRMVPSALLTPLLSPFADRGRRERVLVVVSTLRAGATGGAAFVVALGGPVGAVYVLAALSTVAATLYRPAHSALLPSLCHSGYELASANVVRGLLDSVATLIGPFLAAALLAVSGVALVLGVACAASLLAAGLLVGLRYDAPPRPDAPDAPSHTTVLRSAAAGVRAVAHHRDVALIIGLAAAQAFTRGALTVLTVVVAIAVLHSGEPGVGVLTAAVGAGAVLGSLGATFLADTRRLGVWFAVGVALWGLPVVAVGLVRHDAAVWVLFAVVGVGNALIDLSGFTLLARLGDDEMLARIFGILESVVALLIGVGAVVSAQLVELTGIRMTLVAVGLLCPLAALASLPRLRAMDRSVDLRDRDIALLQQVEMLRPLPLPALERLARGLEPVALDVGETVFHQGDVGDRYFVIERGQVAVVGDGRVVASLGAGEGFGEIALLRRSRRTATVRATTELRLRALRSDHFLSAVLGFTPSAREAGAVVDARLGRFSPRADDLEDRA